MVNVPTDLVAWYGATVATVVFAFDVVKWRASRARLRVTVRRNVCYPDGEIIKVEKTPNGEVGSLKQYYHVEIVNTGALSTTLLGVCATTKPRSLLECLVRWHRNIMGEMSDDGRAFIAHYGKTVPYVLTAGDVWSCRVPQDRIEHMLSWGIPKLEVTVSHLPRPLYLRVPTAKVRVIAKA